ncbi:hypothetical protein AYK24_07335 [Thermoplasmatales archaeon SG8-52-4]|nr:MAG: hypothetical protein AYK24_07335 [Thermoplasmatales archaeon SG8-52-4]
MNSNKNILILTIIAISTLGNQQAKADFVFGEPENLGPTINTAMHEIDPGISWDNLSISFQRGQPDWSGFVEAWIAQRTTKYDPWNDAVGLGPWEDNQGAHDAAILKAMVETMGGIVRGWGTADGLELYTWQDKLGGYGGQDLFVMKRETVDANWGPLLNLGTTVNSSNSDYSFFISPDGLTLYFASYERSGGYGRTDIWITTRATRLNPWSTSTNLGPSVNSSSWDYYPNISPDGLLLFFGSGRPGGFGDTDIWITRRASLSDPWEDAVNLGSMFNTSVDDDTPHISPDGSTLYFTSNRPGGYGGYDIWKASIKPIVDLNGDGIVDAQDMCMIVDDWGTDDPLCDIGPMPWGDGIVDVEDLIVLAEHLFEEIPPVE